MSGEGDFEIVGWPVIWQSLEMRRRKWQGKIYIGLRVMGCVDEMGLEGYGL
jgi:hypothetical protein